MYSETLCSLILILLSILIAIAYRIRVRRYGALRFERVDRQGGSSLLSKSLMEAGYWFFEGIARIFIRIRITPNWITWTSLFLGVGAACSFATGNFGVGAFLTAASGTMDALDGMVARMTRRTSHAGEILDSVLDRYVEFSLFAGLLIYYRSYPFIIVLISFALIGSFMVSYSTAKAEAMSLSPPRGNMKRSERIFYFIFGAAFSVFDFGKMIAEFGGIEWSRADEVTALKLPMLLCLFIIALFANISAVKRFSSMMSYADSA